ncbi:MULTISPECIES: M3 family metallopeptidase [Spirulina sp. CCY15215]|uniref:M3 family metallopeptidase n=1 Tax=Spirulina sp. CCY15215 TaxID=2767591 RepID=UPI001951EF57|nr:M3 family metallopeptidase [Spirulina major]
MSDNPLLIGKEPPPFDIIKPQHIVPAIKQLLEDLKTAQTRLESSVTPTWEGLVEPLTEIEERLTWTWGVIGHLMGVKNNSELRSAYETVQPDLIKFSNQINQSKTIYKAFKGIQESEGFNCLEPAQKRIVNAAIRDAELSGVALEGEQQERFNAIELELAELSTKFSNNLLDATKSFKLKLTSQDEVEGLPESCLALAAQIAREEGGKEAGGKQATAKDGPWLITLDSPSFFPFLKYAKRRDLREKLYRARITRASRGKWDNNPIIDRLLALRKEQAKILGFSSYAEVSLAKKMASDVAAVEQLLEELRSPAYEASQKELAELKEFAQLDDLKPWDIPFWSERQREEKFALNAEELRPYFPLPQVLDGLFGLIQRLFGVTISRANGQTSVWHEDVGYFQVKDETGEAIAYFFLDPYSRPAEKRGGAWMDDCICRRKIKENGTIKNRLPVAYMVCNQTPPIDGKPSLMAFEDVQTLFHEFGHGLQHMLTKIDYPQAAGINNIEWDAVELPSQFMENWCYDRATLFGMAKHYETGETLPEHYYQKLLATRHYQSGLSTLRQLHFGLLDIELHHRYQPRGKETPKEVRDRIAKTTMVIPPLPEDAFLCSFGHIFSGGYAAGYYSYHWAEVLSADAFSAFEEVGLENEEAIIKTGRRFRNTVLALGGSLSPMEVFKSFRDREPKTEPLLRHKGLIQV